MEWLFFYFGNGGDVVAVAAVGGECAVPLSLDGVNYMERQMVSITQGGVTCGRHAVASRTFFCLLPFDSLTNACNDAAADPVAEALVPEFPASIHEASSTLRHFKISYSFTSNCH